MKQRVIYILIFLCIGFSLDAQTKTDSTGLNRLNGGLKALSLDADLKHAGWSFCLMDPKNGKIITEYQSERSLNPASCMKVVTTLSALHILGENYTYTTAIQYDGNISSDSILNGNLYIRGSGDPTLGSTKMDSVLPYDSLLMQWAAMIHAKGIKKITGNIIADASAFENYATPGSWNWDDIGQYYGAGPFGLNINENAYSLYYTTTASIARIDSIVPEIEGMTVFNDVKVGGTGDEAYIYGAPDNYYRYVTGTIPANRKAYTVDGSMPDPPMFLALALKQALIKNGVEVNQQATTVYAMERANMKINKDRKLLFNYTSPPLSEIIFRTNQESINLYAEALIKTMGLEKLGTGSREAGLKVVKSFWLSKNIDLEGFNMDDGSGLSRMDIVTTKQMCQLLSYAAQQPGFATFKRSLPISGQTGTLKTITDGTSAAGKIFAKSGSMYKVRCYSGYVKTKSGELLAFSVLTNNYTCGTAAIKSKLEKLMIWMAGL